MNTNFFHGWGYEKHYGKPRIRSEGKRPVQQYFATGCSAVLRLHLDSNGEKYKVTNSSLTMIIPSQHIHCQCTSKTELWWQMKLWNKTLNFKHWPILSIASGALLIFTVKSTLNYTRVLWPSAKKKKKKKKQTIRPRSDAIVCDIWSGHTRFGN